MAFEYKDTPTKVPVLVKKPTFANEPEQLSGQVNGIDAAQDEERYARALDRNKAVRRYWFRINPTGIPKGMPGWLELDFLVETGFEYRAFELDDMEFVHRGQRKGAEMVIKDLKRREGLALMGIVVKEIEHIDAAKLQNQDDADRTVRNLL